MKKIIMHLSAIFLVTLNLSASVPEELLHLYM
jgi:hypothetical protein